LSLSAAVLGPVPVANIIEVLHCTHIGRKLGVGESVRSFEDGKLLSSIQHLKDKLAQKRPDAWALKKLGLLTQNMSTRQVPDLTDDDYLRRLRQGQVKAS
jgi:hypothetical protein